METCYTTVYQPVAIMRFAQQRAFSFLYYAILCVQARLLYVSKHALLTSAVSDSNYRTNNKSRTKTRLTRNTSKDCVFIIYRPDPHWVQLKYEL
jgi:hypothetical protein